MASGNEGGEHESGPYGRRQYWRVMIDAPIETVWNTLVKTDTALPFFFGAVCDAGTGLAEGRPMRMLSRDRKNAVVVGEVVEFKPPSRYSHTIYFTQVEGEQPALTTYELRGTPKGTEFTRISEALPGTKIGKMVESGPFIVENLNRFVETGKPAVSGAMALALGPLINLFTPKVSRVERWPLDATAWNLRRPGEEFAKMSRAIDLDASAKLDVRAFQGLIKAAVALDRQRAS